MTTHDTVGTGQQGYAQDAVTGRFYENPEFATAINSGTVEYELPHRGEITQVVSTDLGPFGRTSVLGVLRETWFGDQSNQWIVFPNLQAALAWSRSTVAQWLREHNGTYSNQHFAVWHGTTWWSVEIDRYRQRYTVVVGLAPGVMVECYDSKAEMPDAHEPRALTEARGWARVVELLPVGREDWPWGMANEHDQVLAAVEALTAEREEQAAAEQERKAAAAAAAIAAARPTRWWARLWAWITAARTA
ncbi:hypothetical protein F7Q99_36780 [Streptomyces kaniharaensis]|uniref:Uncharacterized protein n=1 Tax=Streptomyces kaniharaensis TaxID=212423 RepID=A0A6N7L438_9ACTN|nr:hypothetical protein [Streptomyces kaniharaensis]MQS17597.1 hypothetical protein [Streptomyces kaniharaensis]